jgi:parallel beta-helix repeat protein
MVNLNKKTLARNTVTIFTSTLLILLIFLTGSPDVNAIYLDPGEPDNTSVNSGTTILFENVTLTIRSDEKIPINFLKFTIYNQYSNQEVAYVQFNVNGIINQDYPEGSFEVIKITSIPSSWYGYGYNWGYDEHIGQTYYFNYGYGYGYGNIGFTDITFVYDIRFTTDSPGTFYSKLSANCTTHEYTSESSTQFLVISLSPPIPQKEEVTPEQYTALTNQVDFIYDFNDLENDLDRLNLQISGPSPYNNSGNFIEWTFLTNPSNIWEGWTTSEINLAQEMRVTPSYNSSEEKWVITIDTNATWINTNPWNQPINSSIWPSGQYRFNIEVVDNNGNSWGKISTAPSYSNYIYSFHKIQPAINAAPEGSIIHILNGTYNDTLIIDKNVILIGSGLTILQPETIPQAGIFDVKLNSGASGSIIENIIFDFNGKDNNRSGTGISIGENNIGSTHDVKIVNNVIYPGNIIGVGGTAIQTATNTDISGLIIENNQIYGNDSSNGNGIYIQPHIGFGNVEIYKNIISGNITYGISLESSKIHISCNEINNSIAKGIAGIRFIDTLGGQIYDEVNIFTNEIHNFQYAIIIGNPTNTGSVLQAEISSNIISNNDVGILARYGADLINSVHFNNIFNNINYGINNIGNNVVNATFNWWGDPSGPTHASNPSGTGDVVSNTVLFTNWLTSYWNNTVYVDDNYDSGTPGWSIDHFNNIIDGINAVFDGGRVMLSPGVYKEVIRIDKPMSLQAKLGNPYLTVISDEGVGYSEMNNVDGQTIQIASKDVSIVGLMILRENNVNMSLNAAVGNKGFSDIYNIHIEDCVIKSIYNGIYLQNIENVSIFGNQNLTSDLSEILFDSITDFSISYNLLNQSLGKGIDLYDCENGFIFNNTILKTLENGINIDKSELIAIFNCVLENNTDGILVINSTDIFIINSEFNLNENGIKLFGNARVALDNNSFYNNSYNITHAAYVEDYYYFGSIQTAVESAGIGNQIDVYHGTYEENVVIDKKVILKGKYSSGDVIIDGGDGSAAIQVALTSSVKDVIISNMSITGGDTCIKTGKYMDVTGLIIQDCIINNPNDEYAVVIDPNQYSDYPPIRNGTNPFIRPVLIRDNYIRGGLFYQYKPFELYGVDIDTQLIIEENNMDIIELNSSLSVEIRGNELWNLGLRETYLAQIENNNFTNKPGTIRNGVLLWSIENEYPVDKINIHNNSIVGYSYTSTKDGVSGVGVVVAGANDVTVSSNEFIANTKGVWATEDYINVNGQRCLGDIQDLFIKDNQFEKSETGIKLLVNVSNAIIENNLFSQNGQGIWLEEATNNQIYHNNITDQYYGIRIGMNSSNNIIYDNYFINNDVHAFDQFSNNTWNTTITDGPNIIGGPKIGGNYWDDYLGIDTDTDSIGDTNIPYNNSGNIINGGDFLPLILHDNIPPTVNVIYPNGGEIFNTSNITIQWIADDNSGKNNLNINIYYSDNAGETWQLISQDEENDDEYLWDIQNLPEGQNYLIKIEAYDVAGNIQNDTSDATFAIVEEDQPAMEVHIVNPTKGYIYFFDKKVLRIFPNFNFIIGDITVTVEVDSVVDINKVEFYVDDLLMSTSNSSVDNVFSWNWDERVIFRHEITVIAYDVNGNTESDTIVVLMFNWNFIP